MHLLRDDALELSVFTRAGAQHDKFSVRRKSSCLHNHDLLQCRVWTVAQVKDIVQVVERQNIRVDVEYPLVLCQGEDLEFLQLQMVVREFAGQIGKELDLDTLRHQQTRFLLGKFVEIGLRATNQKNATMSGLEPCCLRILDAAIIL